VTGRFHRDLEACPLPLDKTAREGEKASPCKNSRVIMAAISGRSWQACKEADRADTTHAETAHNAPAGSSEGLAQAPPGNEFLARMLLTSLRDPVGSHSGRVKASLETKE
jgi:hypothetical protein